MNGRLGQTVCQTPEEFKSWSQNLEHEKVLTTFYSYGEVQEYRQGEILKLLKKPRVPVNINPIDFAKEVGKALAEQQSKN
jgi:integrase/recombinase XerD